MNKGKGPWIHLALYDKYSLLNNPNHIKQTQTRQAEQMQYHEHWMYISQASELKFCCSEIRWASFPTYAKPNHRTYNSRNANLANLE